MVPLQILLNNFLYDISQTTLPTDNVDPEYILRPQKWDVGTIRRFIFFIGPISSIFDYCTYALMLFVFHAWNNPVLFHTGWFVESLVTQTLIIHVIRTNKIPFFQSRASMPVFLTTLGVILLGMWLPFSQYAPVFGFTALPPLYWGYLLAMVCAYILFAQYIKTLFFKRYALH